MSKRLFIAIPYRASEEIYETINFLKDELHEDIINWVDLHILHLTLQFLGDTDPAVIADLTKSLQLASKDLNSFSLRLTSLDVFYRGGLPSVLYLHVNNSEALLNLENSIYAKTQYFGFERDKRRFKAHITLGRIKYIKDLQLFKELLNEAVNHIFTVDSFCLYESQLKGKGAQYKILNKFYF